MGRFIPPAARPPMYRVLLLQNHAVVGERLRCVIATMPDMAVAGVTVTLAQAARSILLCPPDLLLVDLELVTTEFETLLDELCGHARETRPLVLVGSLSLDNPKLIDAILRGADGYFLHDSSVEALQEAIRQVVAGESPLAPHIARRLRARFDAPAWNGAGCVDETRAAIQLSEAQLQMLERLCDGYLVHEIAREMQTTPHDVGLGIRTLYRKLQLDRRAASLAGQEH
jgi:DNA-binding NarL/FixJ family response regulator